MHGPKEWTLPLDEDKQKFLEMPQETTQGGGGGPGFDVRIHQRGAQPRGGCYLAGGGGPEANVATQVAWALGKNCGCIHWSSPTMVCRIIHTENTDTRKRGR